MTKARSSEKNIYFTPLYKNATVTGSRLFSIISLQKHKTQMLVDFFFSPAVRCWSELLFCCYRKHDRTVDNDKRSEQRSVILSFKHGREGDEKDVTKHRRRTAAGSNFSCKVSALCIHPSLVELQVGAPTCDLLCPSKLNLAHEVPSEKKRFIIRQGVTIRQVREVELLNFVHLKNRELRLTAASCAWTLWPWRSWGGRWQTRWRATGSGWVWECLVRWSGPGL